MEAKLPGPWRLDSWRGYSQVQVPTAAESRYLHTKHKYRKISWQQESWEVTLLLWCKTAKNLKDKHDTCSKQKQDLTSCTTPQSQAFGSHYTHMHRTIAGVAMIRPSAAASRVPLYY